MTGGDVSMSGAEENKRLVFVVKRFKKLDNALNYIYEVANDDYFMERIRRISLMESGDSFKVIVDMKVGHTKIVDEFLNVHGRGKVIYL